MFCQYVSMLTVQAVGAGRAAYHSGQPGCWWGAATARLGVSGAADGAGVAAVLAGRHPVSGEPLPIRRVTRRRAGWEVVVGAPKSVSVLTVLADEQASKSLAWAHGIAAAAAFTYLESEAARCRRADQRVAAEGLVAAAYEHRASAAGEPHLHTHLVVANLGLCEGRWLALDGRYIFWQARAAGALYHMVLRDTIRRAGMEFGWRINAGGAGDVEGVAPAALEAASSRRARMLEDAGNRTSRAALEVSRRRTRLQIPDHGWRAAVAESGLGPAAVAELIGRSRAPGGKWVGAPVAPATIPALGSDPALSRPREPARKGPPHGPTSGEMPALESVEGRLIERGSYFRPADVLPALAEAAPGGLDAAAVRRRVSELCERAIQLPGGMLVSRRALEADGAVVRAALSRRSSGAGVALPPTALPPTALPPTALPPTALPAAGVAATGSSPARLGVGADGHLDAAGRRCADHLVTSGNGVEVLGPGTRQEGRAPLVAQAAVIDAARVRWQAAGHSVAVVTQSAYAAARWEAATGLDTRERTASTPTVLIVDRADRWSTPQLGALLADAAADGTKVVLVEGGTSPARQVPRSAALREMADALGRLDPGVAPSLQAAVQARFMTSPHQLPDPAGTLGQAPSGFRCDAELLARWNAARLSGAGMPLMVAAGPAEAAVLNGAARALLRAGGALRGEGSQLGGLAVHDGERVVALRRQGTITAGTLGYVSIATNGEVALRWEGTQRPQTLRPAVTALGYGYATTPSYLRQRAGGPAPPDLLVRGDPVRLGVDAARVRASWRVAPPAEIEMPAALRRSRGVHRQGRSATEQGRMAPFAGRGIV